MTVPLHNRRDFILSHTRPIPVGSVPEISLYQADDVTTLWQMTEADLNQAQLPPPFWAFAWAGGQVLSRYILDHPECVARKRVFDLACGSGIVGIAAMKAGALGAIANDIDPYAEAAVTLNAALNRVEVGFEGRDRLSDDIRDVDVILAGDICYERPMAEAMMAFLKRAKASGIDVLIGDPGRSYFPAGLTQLGQYEIATHAQLEDKDVKTCRVWRH